MNSHVEIHDEHEGEGEKEDLADGSRFDVGDKVCAFNPVRLNLPDGLVIEYLFDRIVEQKMISRRLIDEIENASPVAEVSEIDGDSSAAMAELVRDNSPSDRFISYTLSGDIQGSAPEKTVLFPELLLCKNPREMFRKAESTMSEVMEILKRPQVVSENEEEEDEEDMEENGSSPEFEDGEDEDDGDLYGETVATEPNTSG